MSKAYLCVTIDIKSTPPQVVSACVYSESATSLTTIHGSRHAEIIMREGDSFKDAREQVLNIVKHSGTYFAWLWPFLNIKGGR